MKREETVRHNLIRERRYKAMSASTGVEKYVISYDPEDQVCRLVTHYERHNPSPDDYPRVMDLDEAIDIIITHGYRLQKEMAW